jgi:uncharacterized membrane protein YhaH (DUF805 family)
MHWYQEALRKYADFSTRSRRMEYWMFLLVNLVIGTVLGAVGGMLGMRWISIVYSIFVFVPGLAVSVRRLHDSGRSGWWLLLVCVPILGWLVLLYFYVQEGQPGDNEYGPNPKVAVAV